MKITVYWKETQFLEVEKVDEYYFSKILPENYLKVKEDGCPIIFLDKVKIVDNKLPNIIKNRLPKTEYLLKNVDKESDIESGIIEYINRTKCKRVTDYITLDIEQ